MKTLLLWMMALSLGTAVAAEKGGAVTQWSTIDALLKGHFYGAATLAEVKTHGDFGLGTFEGLDGELLLLDGVVYRVDERGKVTLPADETTTPFVAVATFKADIKLEVPAGLTLAAVQARVGAVLPS